MPQAIMDPEEVRRFAEELKRFNMDLQNRMASLQARFSALGDSWQDQEHTKFSEELTSPPVTHCAREFLALRVSITSATLVVTR